MKHFYKLGNLTDYQCEESIYVQSGSTVLLSGATDPLIIQFLSAFADDKTQNTSPPLFLQILLSKCCAQPSIQEFRTSEVEFASKVNKRALQNPARYRVDRFTRYIYESDSLEAIINSWRHNVDAMHECTRDMDALIPTLRGIDTSLLRELIITSPFFKLAVALYIDPTNSLDDPHEYFSCNRSIRIEPRKSPLREETERIRLLCELARKYLIDPKTEIDKDVSHLMRLFIRDYLDIDLNQMAISRSEYDISICMRSLLSTTPTYSCDESDRPRQSERNAARAYHYYQNNQFGNLGRLRLARYTYHAYIQDKDLLCLNTEQSEALQRLGNLLPYQDKIQPTISGFLPPNMRYFFDKQCTRTHQDIFDEFEMRAKKENVGYLFTDYFEACCVSLVCQSRHNHPIRKCSLCGRYHIAKQNRLGETIYCYRASFQNPKKRCSEYNSHHLKKNEGSPRRKALNKKIDTIRPYFSKITKVDSPSNFDDCVLILKSWLVTAKAEAKRLDLLGKDLADIEQVVSKIDQLRFQLDDDRVQNRIMQLGYDRPIEVLINTLSKW